MSLWWILLVVCVAGAVGGVVNALMSDNGFVLPQTKDGIIRPGYLGNVLISAVAAGISWGMYGPFADYVIFGVAPTGGPSPSSPNLKVAALVGAVLVGVAGARWLTNEVDKKLLKAAASEAAGAKATDVSTAKKILMASPAQALDIAKSLPS
jgi:hypothetical protein